MITLSGVGVKVTSEFESNFIETELDVGMLEGFPALIWCKGGSQVFTKCAELEFSVQEAAEISRENNVGGPFRTPHIRGAGRQSKLRRRRE